MLRGHMEGSNNNNSGEEEELVTVSVFPHAVAAAAPEEEEEVNTSSSSDDDERNDNANAPHEPFEHGSPAGQRHTTRRPIHTNQYYHDDEDEDEEDEDDVRQCRSPPQEVPLDALIHEVAELQATEDRLKSRTTTALSTTIDKKSDGMSTDVSSIHNARWEEAKARLRRQAATTVMPAQRRSAEWDESESDGETIRFDAALSPLSYDEYISEEDLASETSGALKRRSKVVVHEVLPWYTEWAHSLYNWIRYLSIANAHVPGVDLYEANNPRAYFQRKEYTL